MIPLSLYDFIIAECTQKPLCEMSKNEEMFVRFDRKAASRKRSETPLWDYTSSCGISSAAFMPHSRPSVQAMPMDTPGMGVEY